MYMFLALPLMAIGPGPVALEFLEKLKIGDVDYGPGGDTALLENTTGTKRALISEQLKKVGRGLGAGSLEVGKVMEDGDYAAVLIRKIGSYNSSNMNVIPIALVRQKGVWLPAPVVASFENAVVGYTMPLKERLEVLEMWMLRERVVDLELVISDTAERMKRDILKCFPVSKNGESSPDEVVKSFMKACQQQSQAVVLGYLGGAEEERPSDWEERMAISQEIVKSGAENELPWRLVISPEVIREVVYVDRVGDRVTVSVACLDPALVSKHGSVGKIKLLHFDVWKSELGWFLIDLPEALLRNEMEALNLDGGLDIDLLDRFTKELRKKEKARGSDSSEEVEKKILDGLKGGGLRELLTRVDFNGSPKEARIAVTDAAEVWWELNDPAVSRVPIKMGFKKDGDLAIACYQWFSMAHPDRFELKTFSFRNTEDGWMWAPGIVSKEERKSHALLNDWSKSTAVEWELSWREKLLAGSVRIEKMDGSSLATDDEVEYLLEAWNLMLEERDLEGALALTSWLGDKGDIPDNVIRNTNYEVTNTEKYETKTKEVLRGEFWVVAVVAYESEKDSYFSFMPILNTEKGFRVLPEINLVYGTGRTRKFLNDQSFKRLEEVCEKEQILELRGLFEKFSVKAEEK